MCVRLPPDLSGWAPAADGRLNLLLVGGDSRSDTGLDAKSLRTDSMILLSVDIASCKAALFSFPRNLCTATDGSCGDGTRYPDWLELQLPSEDTSSPAGQAAFPNGDFTASPNICQGMNSDGLLTSLWHVAAWCDQVFAGSNGDQRIGLPAAVRLRPRMGGPRWHAPELHGSADRRRHFGQPEWLRRPGECTARPVSV